MNMYKTINCDIIKLTIYNIIYIVIDSKESIKIKNKIIYIIKEV